MDKFIRVKGVSILISIIIIVVTLAYLFLDPIVKYWLERHGSNYIGAEVNIDSVEVSFNPVTVKINDFQATDAFKPERNLLSFSFATIDVDIVQLLFGRIVINELLMEGVEFYNKRKSQGKVFIDVSNLNDRPLAELDKIVEIPNLELESLEKVFKQENLNTVKAGQQLKNSIDLEKRQWQSLEKKLPNSKTLELYKKQVKAFSNIKIKSPADVEKLHNNFKSLQQKIEFDIQSIQLAQDQLNISKEKIENQVSLLEVAFQKDQDEIEHLLELDSELNKGFVRNLFSVKAQQYYEKSVSLIDRFAPQLINKKQPALMRKQTPKPKDAGRYISFEEENPMPEFLIKNARILVSLPIGEFKLDVKELTHQHWLRQLPTVLAINSSQLKQQGHVYIAGQFKLTKLGEVDGGSRYNISQMAIPVLNLIESESLSLTLDAGSLSTKGDFSVVKSHLVGHGSFNFEGLEFKYKAQSSTARLLSGLIDNMNEFSVEMDAKGKMDAINWQFSSSVDDLISEKISQELNRQALKLESDLINRVKAQYESFQSEHLTAISEINHFDNTVGKTQNSLNLLLTEELADAKKSQLENKLINKLEELFK